MAKDPAFPFYAQDFLSGTAFMTLEEKGAYITLLSNQWNIGKIPKKRLGFVLGYGWESIFSNISDKFKEEDGFIFNERLEIEREKRLIFKEKQRINGQKGGRPRNPNKSQTEPKQKPLEDEYESEKEVEYHIENAYDYLKEINKEKIDIFEMQNKKSFSDYNQFIENFNCVVVEKKLEWDEDILFARLRRLNTNWDKTPKKTNGSKMDELREKLKKKTL